MGEYWDNARLTKGSVYTGEMKASVGSGERQRFVEDVESKHGYAEVTVR